MDLVLAQLVFGLEPDSFDDGHPAGVKFLQVVLVGIPLDHICVVQQPGDGFRPRQELLSVLGVVVYRTQNAHARRRPVHCGVVPLLDSNVDATRGKSLRKLLFAVVKFRVRRAGHQRHEWFRHANNLADARRHGSHRLACGPARR